MEFRIFKSEKIKRFIPIIGLIFIVLLFTIISKGKLLTLKNMEIIINQAVFLIISGMGVLFVISQGSLDLSQGSLLGLSSAVAAILASFNPYLSIPGAILTGLIVGLINGLLLAFFKIPSFIITISMLVALRGLTIFATRSGSISMPFSLYWLDSFWLRAVILIIVIIVFGYMFVFTKIGKYSKALGSNEVSARFSGIPINRTKIMAFCFAGFLCGICGFLNSIRTGVAAASTGVLFEVDVLTALVLGGLPLTGGSASKVYSPIIGGLMLAILGNGLIISGVDVGIQQGLKGIIFLLAIAASFNRESNVFIK
jgi:ribose transport system permease protein